MSIRSRISKRLGFPLVLGILVVTVLLMLIHWPLVPLWRSRSLTLVNPSLLVESTSGSAASLHAIQLQESYQNVVICANKTGAVLDSQRQPKKETQKYIENQRDLCIAKHGQRTFLSPTQRRLPPILYTYPGSGNTWSRLLIEYATGILSGSVYDDRSLLDALPGELQCGWNVSVVKVHPHTHIWNRLYKGTFLSDRNKCKKQGVHHFERAILLLRDPFDSIWSEYQRRLSRSHVDGISKQNFDWHRWQANAAAMTHSYNRMWEQEYAGIERDLPKKNILYLKYEDLKDESKRLAVLREIVQFLGINEKQLTDERLSCAFLLADHRKTHRKVESSLMMSKREAYLPEIVCRMWTVFGKHAKRFGYVPANNISCSDVAYPPMPNLNVGGNGEYGKKWIRAGQKMVDFRTPESIARFEKSNGMLGERIDHFEKVREQIKQEKTSSRAVYDNKLAAL